MERIGRLGATPEVAGWLGDSYLSAIPEFLGSATSGLLILRDEWRLPSCLPTFSYQEDARGQQHCTDNFLPPLRIRR